MFSQQQLMKLLFILIFAKINKKEGLLKTESILSNFTEHIILENTYFVNFVAVNEDAQFLCANRKQGPDHEALSFNIWSSNLISIFQVINAALYYILDAELLNLNLSKWHQSCLYMVDKSIEYITFYPDKWKIQCCLKERGWSLWWQ